MIGRLGRSLGVHLLLASQRLEEGRLRGLDTHLSYRIGLRTFSAMESRGRARRAGRVRAAARAGPRLPEVRTPSTLIRFKAAYVSGRVPARRRQRPPPRRRGAAGQVVPYGTDYVPVPVAAGAGTPARAGAPADGRPAASLLDVLVDRLRGPGPAGPPGLAAAAGRPADAWTSCCRPLAVDPSSGLHRVGWPGRGRLTVPVGVVDQPFEQRRDPLLVDLAGRRRPRRRRRRPAERQEHAAAHADRRAGAHPHARARCSSTASTSAAARCAALRGLPHVGGVAGRRDAERGPPDGRRGGRRCWTTGSSASPQHGIDSMASLPAGAGPPASSPTTRSATCSWSRRLGHAARRSSRSWSRPITDARHPRPGLRHPRGASPPTRWTEIRPGIRDLLGTRLELRLGDPIDSEIDRRAAANVPEQSPGRGPDPRTSCTS